MASTCTVCGTYLIGHPDDDITCADCEKNFVGDLLRYPPQGTQSWWLVARGALAPRPDGLRALTRAGTWSWRADDAREEGSHGH